MSYSNLWKRGADRSYLAILHSGQALYATNAGKLNGLAPEAYIQPQDSILDDGYFKINQQTKEIYDKPGYTVDRWAIIGEYTKAEVVDDGIKITTTQPTRLNIFMQPIEIEKDLIGEDLAATAELGDSSNGADIHIQAYSASHLFLGESQKFVNSNSAETFHFVVPENTKYLQFIFRPAVYGQETFFVIKRAKLEKGRRFTGWQAWNYALELAKCQRYALEMVSAFNTKFGEIGVGSASNAIRAVIFCPVPVSLRVKPTVSFTGDFRLVESGSWQEGIPVTSITVNQVTTNGVSLYVDTAGGLSAGKWYKLAFNNSEQNSLLLNANL